MARTVRYAASFHDNFRSLLVQGRAKFGDRVAEEKSRIVTSTAEIFLRDRPHLGRYERKLKLLRYRVTDTPFVLLYDYDDAEIRFHTIVHARSDIPNTDLTAVRW